MEANKEEKNMTVSEIQTHLETGGQLSHSIGKRIFYFKRDADSGCLLLRVGLNGEWNPSIEALGGRESDETLEKVQFPYEREV